MSQGFFSNLLSNFSILNRQADPPTPAPVPVPAPVPPAAVPAPPVPAKPKPVQAQPQPQPQPLKLTQIEIELITSQNTVYTRIVKSMVQDHIDIKKPVFNAVTQVYAYHGNSLETVEQELENNQCNAYVCQLLKVLDLTHSRKYKTLLNKEFKYTKQHYKHFVEYIAKLPLKRDLILKYRPFLLANQTGVRQQVKLEDERKKAQMNLRQTKTQEYQDNTKRLIEYPTLKKQVAALESDVATCNKKLAKVMKDYDTLLRLMQKGNLNKFKLSELQRLAQSKGHKTDKLTKAQLIQLLSLP